jgi:demethylspheroidene O-methyltransferase
VLGAALVGNPAIAAMVVHHGELYADLRDPVALLRGEAGHTALRRYWAYAQEPAPAALKPEQVAPYTELMAASQPLVADEILDAFAPRGRLHWLDVGGGDGSFVCAAARRYPKLAFTLFDLPGVAEQAARRLQAEGLTGRAAVIAGDFRRDPLPRGADVISLVRVIHDHDDAAALEILRAVRAALPQDGVCIIAEPMAGASGAEPIGDAYFGFYLLAMGQGRARTPGELTELLRGAGFRSVKPRRTRMPLLAGVLVARP